MTNDDDSMSDLVWDGSSDDDADEQTETHDISSFNSTVSDYRLNCYPIEVEPLAQ